ncbi:MAG: MurR/RpiR family transcriptional regulator [Spirochaetes bacterium]|nr:MurR/RpiR family transcriptional regulator [Spirochaetota bacterium]
MVLEKIKDALPSMSPNFRKIASHILDHETSVPFISIHDLSRSLQISTATLVRFAQSLGYRGYQGFKRDLQNEIRQRLQPDDRVSLSKLGSLPEDKRLRKLIQNEHNNLRRTLNNLKLEDLERMIQRVKGARRIFVAGFGITQYFACVLYAAFLATQEKDVYLVSGSISNYSQILKRFGAEDVLFLLTFPPYSAEVNHVARVVKDQKGTLYLFTDSANCPVYSDADIVVKCVTHSLVMTNSFVGLVSLIHVFMHMLLLSSEDKGRNVRIGFEIEKLGYSILSTKEGRS